MYVCYFENMFRQAQCEEKCNAWGVTKVFDIELLIDHMHYQNL